MTPRIAELLELERRKLSLLRNKVLDQERRVEVLAALVDDPLDALLERELTAPAAAVQAPAPGLAAAPESAAAQPPEGLPAPGFAQVFNWAAPTTRVPRRVPSQWVQLLRFIGLDGKTYNDVTAYARSQQLQISEGAVRTQLMNYRKEYGFVENPKKGFYRATERALSFIDAQEEGAPAMAGGSPQSQPSPLTRAAA